jgi:hypothetical protein
MSYIKRDWTSESADNWSKEDWIAIILSSLSYFLLTIGTALSFLLLTSGFIVLSLGIVVTILMYWVIDPKLKKISTDYEKKQKGYLEHIEEIQRWEVKS